MKQAVVGFLLLAALTAGCLQGVDETPNGGEVTPPIETHTSLSLDAAPCQVVAVAALVEPATAYRSLPPGFRPRDSRGLFETGASTGKVPIFIAGVDCTEGENDLGDGAYNIALVGIFIEPPTVQGHASDSEYDFYLSHIYTENPELRNAFTSLQWSHDIGTAMVQVNLEQAGQSNTGGFATIDDAEGEVAYMVAAAIVPIPAGAEGAGVGFHNWTIKFWHQNDAGVGYLDYRFTSDAPLGPGACDLRYDSPPAYAIGQSDCPYGSNDNLDEEQIIPEEEPRMDVTGDITIAAVFRNLDLEGDLIWMPGKVAQ